MKTIQELREEIGPAERNLDEVLAAQKALVESRRSDTSWMLHAHDTMVVNWLFLPT